MSRSLSPDRPSSARREDSLLAEFVLPLVVNAVVCAGMLVYIGHMTRAFFGG